MIQNNQIFIFTNCGRIIKLEFADHATPLDWVHAIKRELEDDSINSAQLVFTQKSLLLAA
tara:strand:- start:7919 stop:8098 length:180 start_codon:yes stop_codon:yes gene_type:complete